MISRLDQVEELQKVLLAEQAFAKLAVLGQLFSVRAG